MGRGLPQLGGHTDAEAADADPFLLGGLDDAVEAAILLTEQIFGRDPNILKGNLGGVGAKPAVLLEFCYRDARRRTLNDEQRNAAATLGGGIGARGDDQDVAIDRIRDE